MGWIRARPPASTQSLTKILAWERRERAYFSWTVLDTLVKLLSKYWMHANTFGSFGIWIEDVQSRKVNVSHVLRKILSKYSVSSF